MRTARANDGATTSIPFFVTSLVSLCFAMMAALCIGGIAYIFLTDSQLLGTDSSVENWTDLLWALATSYGFIRPLLILGAAVMLLRLASGLTRRDVGAARWAKSILAWLAIIGLVGTAAVTFGSLQSEDSNGAATGTNFIRDVLPWFLVWLFSTALWLIHSRTMGFYSGDEDVSHQRARRAWNMLAPILIIFLLIGIGPLERVFITSLTDEPFAIGIEEEPRFIGLANFRNLLGVRIDTLPCETDQSGACLTEIDANGNSQIAYPRARRYLNDNVEGYRASEGETELVSFVPYDEFDIFGNRYVLSVRDPDFIDSFINSIVYSTIAISLQLVIGLFMAMILTAKMRGMGLMRVAMLVPLAIPTLIATQFWDVMLRPDASGLINNSLIQVGLINEPQRWLLDTHLQIPSLILVIVWKETPSMALLLLPGLLSISPEIYQAASVDGASKVQQFFKLTLPMMRPTIGVALILRTMVMLRVFDVFEVLLGRRQFSMASYAYDRLTQESLLGYSSAISVVIFLIILLFTVIYMRTLNIDEG